MQLAGKYAGMTQPLLSIQDSPEGHPEDYFIPSEGMWRSQLLPQDVTIDQAIMDGTWEWQI